MFSYKPATCEAPTLSVAPTYTICDPAVKVPVVDGVLVKVLTVMVAVPTPASSSVRPVEGNVIAYVYTPSPPTVNLAAVGVPVAVVGKVTPPEAVLAGVAEAFISTVPAVLETATFPKFISTFLVIVIGATIVAVVGAFAVTCAEAVAEKAIDKVAIAIIELIFFIVEKDLGVKYCTNVKATFLNIKQEVITAT